MNVETSAFASCVKANIYLLLYNLDCTFTIKNISNNTSSQTFNAIFSLAYYKL